VAGRPALLEDLRVCVECRVAGGEHVP
jgi:hypothetical protein